MAEGRRERVKEKVSAAGLDALAAHEVLEVMLYPHVPRKDTVPLARALLLEFGSIEGVLNASESELLKVKGMPKGAAFHFPLYTKIIARAKTETITRKEINNYLDAKNFLTNALGFSATETVSLLCLDAKKRVIKNKILNEGAAYNSEVNMRLIAETALSTKMAFAILAHNHPSGELTPSKDDIACTSEVKKLLASLDVMLIDHIIVSKNSALSLRKEQLFDFA